jgi:hypothetical protein
MNVVDLRSYNHRKTIESIAKYYNDQSWFVIPLKYGTKQPLEDNWNEKPLDFDLLKQYAQSPINLGVLLGKRVIDIDLDCSESRGLAKYILPQTAVFGRQTAPSSHWVYSLSPEFDDEGVKIQQWRMPKSLVSEDEKSMVMELRGLTKTGKYSQTMFPPSLHPNGELVQWETDAVPLMIEDMEPLHKRLKLLAIASVILKCWDSGIRDDLAIHLTALLLKSDYPADLIISALEGIMTEARDEEMVKRLNSSVRGTIRRWEEGEPIAGSSKLRDILTDDVFQFITKNVGVADTDIPGLSFTGKGAIEKTTENLSLIVRHDSSLSNMLARDEVTNDLVYVNPMPEVEKYGFVVPEVQSSFKEGHELGLSVYIANKYRVSFGPERLYKVLIDIASTTNSVNFLADRIKQCKWDGEERIPTLFQKMFGVKGSFYSTMAKAWFRTAVRRVFEPGCPMEQMIILKGRQHCGKSAFTKILAFDNDQWHCDFSGMMDNVEAQRLASSKWIIELSELSSFRSTKDHNTLKSFITRTSDDYRELYRNKVTSHPRTCVFIGTTNDDSFLTDRTGNRRYWIIEIDPKYNENNTIDLKWLIENRDQLWGEAYHLYKNTTEDEIQKETRDIGFTSRNHEIHEKHMVENVLTAMDGGLAFVIQRFKQKGYVTSAEFLTDFAQHSVQNIKAFNMNMAADALKEFGMAKRRRKVNGKHKNVFVFDGAIPDITSSSIEEEEY